MISNQHHFAQPHSKRRHTVASGHRQRIVLPATWMNVCVGSTTTWLPGDEGLEFFAH